MLDRAPGRPGEDGRRFLNFLVGFRFMKNKKKTK